MTLFDQIRALRNFDQIVTQESGKMVRPNARSP